MMQDIPKSMRGIYLTGHGGLEKLQYREDIPVPAPGPDDVLIKVSAAAVNNTDINTRKAWYSKNDESSGDASWSGEALSFPRIQGADVCGYIVSVGQHVEPNRLGERIMVEPCLRQFAGRKLPQAWYLGSECNGGFAEYLVVPSTHVFSVDSSLSDVELASFPCSYSTAENMLHRAGLKKGERVLVTGASGGVGSAAVQLAKARGASVLAQTSASKMAAVQALGATDTVDRSGDLLIQVGRDSVDVVIDLVAGPQWPQLLETLKPGGRYAVAGAIAGPIVELDVRTLYLKDLTLLGCTVLDEGVFAQLVERIEQNQIKPLVEKTYRLEQITEAQCQFQKKKHVGKLVLEVGSA